MKYNKAWERGDRSTLAREAGISPQYLCDIMHGRKVCHPALAIRLEQAGFKLGYRISRFMWAFPDRRQGNSLFPNAS